PAMRCGECGVRGGSRKVSPARIGISRSEPGPPSRFSCTRSTISPSSCRNHSGPSSQWKSVRELGPPTTITMKSPSWMHLLPTGGLSRWRCSSIQACRLIGAENMAAPAGGEGSAQVAVLFDPGEGGLVLRLQVLDAVHVHAQVVDAAIAQGIDPAVHGQCLAA